MAREFISKSARPHWANPSPFSVSHFFVFFLLLLCLSRLFFSLAALLASSTVLESSAIPDSPAEPSLVLAWFESFESFDYFPGSPMSE